MPNENYIYYGDSLHAPYGNKTKQEIIKYSLNIVNDLVKNGVKAIVIACNTATSAAASEIRKQYPKIPIIGIEPAIKPAVIENPRKKILVLATKATIEFEKFHTLRNSLNAQNRVIPVICEGLAEAIENNKDPKDLLKKYLLPYKNKISIVVLGCTHYPFVKKEIKSILGNVRFYDGTYGTALNLKRQLSNKNLLNISNQKGVILFESSNHTKSLYKQFLIQ